MGYYAKPYFYMWDNIFLVMLFILYVVVQRSYILLVAGEKFLDKFYVKMEEMCLHKWIMCLIRYLMDSF